MTLLDITKAEAVIDSLSQEEIESINGAFDIEYLIGANVNAKGLKDFMHEDYAYVLPVLKYLLAKVNISVIEVEDFCDDCDDDAILSFDMNTGKRTCTVCGSECQEYEILVPSDHDFLLNSPYPDFLNRPYPVEDEEKVLSYNKPVIPGKITGQDLMDWSMENGEDALIDGPWYYDEAQELKLCIKISYAILKKYQIGVKLNELEELFENPVQSTLSNVDEEELHMLTLDCFAELINEDNIKPTW